MAWKLFEGDCLEIMPLEIEDKSVDMILCDLPYGTTACKWDTVIPFKDLWREYERVIKRGGAIVLTASQPFTSVLVNSNLKWFRYEWIWEKDQAPNFLMAYKQPLKKHENVLVFYDKYENYYPIMEGNEKRIVKRQPKEVTEVYGGELKRDSHSEYVGRFPNTLIKFNRERGLHPTQKPVKLFEYLIKTYTNENDLVLDNCAGSGTTGVACEITNRNSILIEKEPEYCEVIKKRLSSINMEQYQPQRVHKSLDAFMKV